jgi:hypothetical protein
MLLQTNSYIVPPEKRAEHARLMRRFRQILNRIGCDDFEIYEQVGANWGSGPTTGRFVQIMRFRDRRHQLAVQNAERGDPAAQQLIAEFCELVNYPLQQQQGQFAVGFYSSVLPVGPARAGESAEEGAQAVTEADATGEVGEAAVAEGEATSAGEGAQAIEGEPELESPAEEGELELEAPWESSEAPQEVAAVEGTVEPAVGEAVVETVPSEDALLEDLMAGGAVTPAEPVEGMAAQDAVGTNEPATVGEFGNGELHAGGGECLDSLIGTDETAELELDGGDALSRLAEEFAAEKKADDANGHRSHAPSQSSDNGAH